MKSKPNHPEVSEVNYEALLAYYSPHINSTINKFRNIAKVYITQEDLYQEACIALLVSIRKFNNTKAKFVTFFSRCIFTHFLLIARKQKRIFSRVDESGEKIIDYFLATGTLDLNAIAASEHSLIDEALEEIKKIKEPDIQTACYLYFEQEFSLNDIRRIMQISRRELDELLEEGRYYLKSVLEISE